MHRVARREAARLPVVAANAGSRRLERVPVEAGLSRHHAGCATSNSDAGHGNVAGWRADYDSVGADSGVEAEEAGTRLMRVLRGHPRAFSAARIVTSALSGGGSLGKKGGAFLHLLSWGAGRAGACS